jgi:hypothetical protein
MAGETECAVTFRPKVPQLPLRTLVGGCEETS